MSCELRLAIGEPEPCSVAATAMQGPKHPTPPALQHDILTNRRNESGNRVEHFHGNLPLFRQHGIALAGEAGDVRRSGPNTGRSRDSGAKLHDRKQAALSGPRGRLDRPAQPEFRGHGIPGTQYLIA
jgi:hypothetical protein